MKKLLTITILSLSILMIGVKVFAQTEDRTYLYNSIDYSITVLPDSTFDVEETQSYLFKGTYHAAERFIPYNKIGSITDISVIDTTTNTPLEYTSSRLDKTKPSSWGKYTHYSSNGARYIEWYYDLTDTEHTWIIKYKVHGGLGFYKDHDELYWNLFQGYTVPIEKVTATVVIPEHSFLNSDAQTAQLYSNFGGGSAGVIDHRTFRFTSEQVPPGSPLTIAAGWPKGVIPQSAYWKDFLKMYWGILFAILTILGFIIFRIIFWYKTSYQPLHRKTIIPEYEAALNIKPAQMEVMVKGYTSNKTWAATIVDLAVRGYVKILEEPKKMWLGGLIKGTQDYTVTRTSKGDEGLEDYEKQFLILIGNRFSTEELRKKGVSEKQSFSKQIEALKKDLYTETASDSKGYSISPTVYGGFFSILLITIIVPLIIFGEVSSIAFKYFGQLVVALGALLLCWLAVILTLKYTTRLNETGIELKRKFLGFKLYLETAERHRVQNLTPDLFEKFLPYAMIFGIEKKWAKAFDSFTMTQPTWYSSPGYVGFAGGSNSSGMSGFSASAFSASFSTSFSSAFATSTGTGGAGGGGSAGGGGGGGGGGAS